MARNVYQTEEPSHFHDNYPMASSVNLFQITHDTNDYTSSVYQTPELNPSLGAQQTLEHQTLGENGHDSNAPTDQVNKQLDYSDH